MKRLYIIYLIFFLLSCIFVHPLPAQIHPVKAYGQLFEDVQLSGIFPDSKTFPDCIPLKDPDKIVEAYNTQKNQEGFELKDFVSEHFQLPQNPSSGFKTDTTANIVEHINALWPVLTRYPSDEMKGSLIPLPKPYVVPGGRFREIYYWDSYFTILGLQVAEEFELIRNMVDNFSFLIETIGFIPNGNRTYYTSRSQPPFYSLMVRLLAENEGEEVMTKYLSYLEAEYDFWMDGVETLHEESPSYRRVVMLEGGEILNRYWDDSPGPAQNLTKKIMSWPKVSPDLLLHCIGISGLLVNLVGTLAADG